MIKKPRILIVDDDRRIRESLATFLEGSHYEVDTASSLAEARLKLETITPALTILDIMLQSDSGFDLLEQDLVPRSIPTIILSARGESEDRINGLEKGAADYICKPFNPRELLLRIKRFIPQPEVGQ